MVLFVVFFMCYVSLYLSVSFLILHTSDDPYAAFSGFLWFTILQLVNLMEYYVLYFDTLLYTLAMNSILHLNCKLHCIVPTKGEQYAYTCELSCIIVHSSLEPYAYNDLC